MFIHTPSTHTVTESVVGGRRKSSPGRAAAEDRHLTSRDKGGHAARGVKSRVLGAVRMAATLASLAVVAIAVISSLQADGSVADRMSNPSPVLVVAVALLAALAAWKAAAAARRILRGRIARGIVAAAAIGGVFGVTTAEAFGPGIAAEEHATSAARAVSVVADGHAWAAATHIRTADGVSLSPLAFERPQPIVVQPFRPLPVRQIGPSQRVPLAPHLPNHPFVAPRILPRPYVAPQFPSRPFIAPQVPVRPYFAPQIPSRPFVAPQIPARPYIAPQIPVRPFIAPQIPIRPYFSPSFR